MEERPAGQEPSLFFFRGAGGRLACQDFFSHGRAARGPVQIFFSRLAAQLGVFLQGIPYRPSPTGLRPASVGPVRIFFRAPRKKIRTELSQARASGRDDELVFFRGPAKFPDSLSGNLAREKNPVAAKTNLDRPGSLG